MSKRKEHRVMQWCRLCEAEAFVSSTLGSKVILDCGHVGDVGKYIDDPNRKRTAGAEKARSKSPTSREVWLKHMERTGQQHAPRLKRDDTEDRPRQDDAQAPTKPAATFDPTAAAKKISELLKKRTP